MQYLKEDIKEKILSSALIEFNEHGYLEASMRNIAAGAGIALGSIYRYFDNKEALFDALIYPVYSKTFAYLSKIQLRVETLPDENNPDAICKITQVIDALIEIVRESNTKIMIILEKSKGSKYENTKNELTDIIYNINLKTFNKQLRNNEYNKNLIYIFTYSFIEGISLIFKQNTDGDIVKTLVNKLIYLFYKDSCKRLDES